MPRAMTSAADRRTGSVPGMTAARYAALALWFLLAATAARADEPPPKAGGADANGGGAAYADDETCVACHAEQAESYGKTPHAAALAGEDRPRPLRGCQACHGPGAAHAEAGGGKGVGGIRAFARTEPAGDRSGACLKCHAGWESLH